MPNKQKEKPKIDIKTENLGFFARLSNLKDAFEKSTPGKILTLATSKMGNRALTVITTSLALAGIAGPLIPIAAVPILITGLVAVGVGIIADTLQVRNIMSLQKENRMLLKATGSKLSQEKILENYQELRNILGNQLSQPERSNQKSIKERYTDPNSPRSWLSKATNASAALNNNFGIINTFTTAVSGVGIPAIGKALFDSAYTLIAGEKRKSKTDSLREVLESEIDQSRAKASTPGYNNTFELKASLREQRIQQLALKELTESPKYAQLIQLATKGTPEDRKGLEDRIKIRFAEIKELVTQKEKAVTKRPLLAEVKTYFTALRKAHDPFSQYYEDNTKKVEISRLNPKTHQIEKIQFKEFQKAKALEEKLEKKATEDAKLEKKVGKIIRKMAPHRIHGKTRHRAKHPSKTTTNTPNKSL